MVQKFAGRGFRLFGLSLGGLARPCAFACRHLGVHVEQFLQQLGVVLEAAADIDALQHFVIALMGMAQVFGHGVGVIEIGNGFWPMGLTGQQNIFGAAREIGLVLFGEWRHGECVPTDRVRV